MEVAALGRPAKSQVDMLLAWSHSLWRELQVPETDFYLLLKSLNFSRQSLRKREKGPPIGHAESLDYFDANSRGDSDSEADVHDTDSTRPRSAPSLRQPRKSVIQSILNKDATTEQLEPSSQGLAEHVQFLLSFRAATLRVLRSINIREDALTNLKAAVLKFHNDHNANASSASVDSLCSACDTLIFATARVIASITAWRCYQWRPAAFAWRGRDYMAKVIEDGTILEQAVAEGSRCRSPSEQHVFDAMTPYMGGEDSLLSFSVPRRAPASQTQHIVQLQKWIWNNLGESASEKATFGTIDKHATAMAAAALSEPIDFAAARQIVVFNVDIQRALRREQRHLRKAGLHLPLLRCPLRAFGIRHRKAATAVFLGDVAHSHYLYTSYCHNVKSKSALSTSRKKVRNGVTETRGLEGPQREKVAWATEKSATVTPIPQNARKATARGSTAKRLSRLKRMQKTKLSKICDAATDSLLAATPALISPASRHSSGSDGLALHRKSPLTSPGAFSPHKPAIVQSSSPDKWSQTRIITKSLDEDVSLKEQPASSKESRITSRDSSATMSRKLRFYTDDFKRKRVFRVEDGWTSVLEIPAEALFSQNYEAANSTEAAHHPLLELEDHPIRLSRLPPSFPCSSHCWWLWENVPIVQGVSSSSSAPRDVVRRKARLFHWEERMLSGVYVIKRDSPASPWLDDDGKLSSGAHGLLATQYSTETQRWETLENEPVDDENDLLWCFRYGQRVALIRGKRPNETVWALASVVAFNRQDAAYTLHMDNGAGLQLDPTGCTRKSLRFDGLFAASARISATDSMRTRSSLLRLGSSRERRSTLQKGSGGDVGRNLANEERALRLLGFDVDDEFVVVRVEDGTLASRLGVQHGWVVVAVSGETLPASTVDGRRRFSSIIVAAAIDHDVVEIEFSCFSHVICDFGAFCYQPGQRLSVFYITQWCDAIVLRPPAPKTDVEALAVDTGSQVRLRVFVGNDAASSFVETVTMSPNHTNHCLRFAKSADYLDYLQTWLTDRNEWGEMFDTVCRCCEHRDKKEKNTVAVKTGAIDVPSQRGALVNHSESQDSDANSSTASSPPPPIYLIPESVLAELILGGRAPTGRPWCSVKTLHTLTNELLAKSGDARLGTIKPVRVILYEREVSRSLVQSGSTRGGSLHGVSTVPAFDQSPVSNAQLSLKSRGTNSTAPQLFTEASENSSNEGTSNEGCKKKEVHVTRAETNAQSSGANPLMQKTITLAEASISDETKAAQKQASMSAAVNAAAKKISMAWIRRSMAHYADIRTAHGQLRTLLMTLSATLQNGHSSTHFVPILVKKESLVRVATRFDRANLEDTRCAPSMLQLYFESAYSRSRPTLYRLLMQILLSGRLILLLDTSTASTASKRGNMDCASSPDEAHDKNARFLVDKYLAERLILEVHRIVIAGGASDQEEAALRGRFITLHVRRGTRAEHEAGIKSWFVAQSGQFANCAGSNQQRMT